MHEQYSYVMWLWSCGNQCRCRCGQRQLEGGRGRHHQTTTISLSIGDEEHAWELELVGSLRGESIKSVRQSRSHLLRASDLWASVGPAADTCSFSHFHSPAPILVPIDTDTPFPSPLSTFLLLNHCIPIFHSLHCRQPAR